MEANQQLGFLQEKIQELGNAIFFNLSDAILKLPTTIVKTLKVDDYGFVWFYVQKPQQNLQEFDSEFPVRMDFFKKGMSYFVQVMGKGWVVTDPEEMNISVNLPAGINQKDVALIKVKILKAEYFETRTSQPTNWWQSAINTVVSWFHTPRTYNPDTTYLPVS